MALLLRTFRDGVDQDVAVAALVRAAVADEDLALQLGEAGPEVGARPEVVAEGLDDAISGRPLVSKPKGVCPL